MTEADAKNLISRYSRSYFHGDSAEGWFEDNKEAQRFGPPGRTIGARAVGGSTVPLLRGKDLTAAMIENVQESRHAVEDCAKRLSEARIDGLLDKEAFNGLSKKTKAAWLAAVQVVKGDYQRAVGEMKQWQDYAELASEGKFPVLKTNGGVEDIIRELADAKSFPPDRRLPPELDDEDVA